MKIRIKKTGEILEDVKFIDTTLSKITIQYLDDGVLRECVVKNLSDIEEVKDHEDEFLYIISAESKDGYECVLKEDYKDICDTAKKLGLDFETEKDVQKAVEKFEAWKRLKNKGFRFKGINMSDGSIKTGLSKGVSLDDCEGFYSDMELLFGGVDE